MSKAFKNKEIYTSIVIFILTVTANILVSYGKHNNIVGVIHGTLTGLSQWVWLLSFIKIMHKPIIGLFGMIVSELILIICDIISGIKVGTAIENALITLSVLIFGTVVNYIVTLSNIKKTKEIKKVTKTELKESLLIDRKPLNIKVWMHIILYSILISVIASVATSKTFDMYGTNIEIRLILAMSVMIPVFINIACCTGTIIMIEMFILKIITEAAVIISIISVDNNIAAKIVYLLAEIFTLLYCVLDMTAREEK